METDSSHSEPIRNLKPIRRRIVGGLIVVLLVLVSMLSGAYLSLVGLRWRGYISSAAPSYILNSTGESATAKDADFGLFWQAWNIIDQKFYGTPKDDKRVDGAISGMVASLGDPYTVYLPPSQNNVFQSDLQGNFGGIGAQLEVKNGQLTVVAPLEGTPAQKGGLLAGDVIISINGKKVADMSFDDAINAIRGDKGTTVELSIGRAGEEKPLTIKLVRDTIVVKSVTTASLGNEKQFAYIKVNQFGQDTTDLFDSALQDAKNQGKKGVIIDLRDDPGGYLDAAVSAIGRVIPAKPSSSDTKLTDRTAVVEKFKDGSENLHKSSTQPILDTVPMVVLVNGGSASASEIFAGAMRDYKRATLVGAKTFGKGSVQELQNLSNGGSVKVTIAKWFTPLGVGIDGKGLEPDVKVELPEGSVPSTDDAQVSRAIELLSK